MEDNEKINESMNNELNQKNIQQENRMNIENEYSSQIFNKKMKKTKIMVILMNQFL